MRILLFFAGLCVQESRSELENDVNKEEQIDNGVRASDEIVVDEAWIWLEEKLQRDHQRVIKGQEYDDDFPVLSERPVLLDEKRR